MAQRRFWNWRDDDYTLDLSQEKLGIIDSGRYRGFEYDASTSGMGLVLSHLGTGVGKVDLASIATPKMGVWVSQQGVVITEDAALAPLAVSPNTSGNPRIDLVIGSHHYVQAVGGVVATYSIVQGTPAASPVAPALPNPTKDVVLGTLLIPNGTTALSVGMYTPSRIPLFANDQNLVRIYGAVNGDMIVFNGSQWIATNADAYIQNLQLNMQQYFGTNGVVYTNPFTPLVGYMGAGADDYGLNVDANLIEWQLPFTGFLAYITRIDSIQHGACFQMRYTGGMHAGITLGAGGGWGLPIIDSMGRTGVVSVVPNRTYSFIQMANYWLLIEEKPRPNWTQTDPVALDYIQNKPEWVDCPASDFGAKEVYGVAYSSSASPTPWITSPARTLIANNWGVRRCVNGKTCHLDFWVDLDLLTPFTPDVIGTYFERLKMNIPAYLTPKQQVLHFRASLSYKHPMQSFFQVRYNMWGMINNLGELHLNGEPKVAGFDYKPDYASTGSAGNTSAAYRGLIYGSTVNNQIQFSVTYELA